MKNKRFTVMKRSYKFHRSWTQNEFEQLKTKIHDKHELFRRKSLSSCFTILKIRNLREHLCLLWIPISTGSARNKVNRPKEFILTFYDDKTPHIIRLVLSDSVPKQHSRLGETMFSEADPFRVQKCTFRLISDPLPDAFHDLFPSWKQLRFWAPEASPGPQGPAR